MRGEDECAEPAGVWLACGVSVAGVMMLILCESYGWDVPGAYGWTRVLELLAV